MMLSIFFIRKKDLKKIYNSIINYEFKKTNCNDDIFYYFSGY